MENIINEEEEKIAVIDITSNGVLNFNNKKNACFDANAASVIVVFFAGGVGIFQSWMQQIKNKEMKLHFIKNSEIDRNKIDRYITGTS